ncbi:MAG: putative Histidine kinase [Frankiales bacterium]|nr:putative Histidine kinase [Frankiales bacterium]
MPFTTDRVRDPDLLAQIVEVSGDAIFSENLDGQITTWNSAAERLYGCSRRDMMGRAAADLLPEQTALQLRRLHERGLAGEAVERVDTWHQRPDGRHIAVSVTVSPLRDSTGTLVGLATSVQDVTDRVRLTAEIEDVHRTLEKQYAALGRSNRDLEQFAYVASHDLSEPLRVMTGFAQLIEKRYVKTLDETGRRYVFHIVDGAARMRTLIDDLLQYSQFLRSDRTAGRVNTAAVVARVVAGLETASVEVEPLPDVWCDEASLAAAMQNLISNALKFTSPDVPARVVVSAKVDGPQVQIMVDDNGIGIEEEYRERVFGMFSRLHVREAYAGTGIGLAIVQQVAERSDGRAWVEHSPLGGSRFCITLPLPPTTISLDTP